MQDIKIVTSRDHSQTRLQLRPGVRYKAGSHIGIYLGYDHGEQTLKPTGYVVEGHPA